MGKPDKESVMDDKMFEVIWFMLIILAGILLILGVLLIPWFTIPVGLIAVCGLVAYVLGQRGNDNADSD